MRYYFIYSCHKILGTPQEDTPVTPQHIRFIEHPRLREPVNCLKQVRMHASKPTNLGLVPTGGQRKPSPASCPLTSMYVPFPPTTHKLRLL